MNGFLRNIKSFMYFNSKQFSKSIEAQKVLLKFKYLSSNKIQEVEANIGETILEIAHSNDIQIEGACESSLACSTCHIVLEESLYDSLPEPSEKEDDLLDQAFHLTHTSRLGCQIKVTKEFEGTIIGIPAATRNMYVDGHTPKPH